VRAKLVFASIAAIFIVAIILSFFVTAEEEKSYIYFQKIDLKPEKINESHVDIKFLISFQRSEKVNASIEISVYDMATDLLMSKLRLSLPERSKAGLGGINTTMAFEKDKNYRVVFEMKRDDKIVDTRSYNLKNLNTLIPREKEIKMSLKDADFMIKGVKDNRTLVLARFYVESMYDYDVLFHIKAIQHESNVLADEKWTNLKIEKGKTKLIESEFEIPKNYNYLIKLEVWKNGSLVRTWVKGLNLAPTKRVPEEIKEEKVSFVVEEFVKTPIPTPALTASMDSWKGGEYGDTITRGVPVPGFEVVSAIVAVGGALLWRKLR
jgi:hypothetical protein